MISCEGSPVVSAMYLTPDLLANVLLRQQLMTPAQA